MDARNGCRAPRLLGLVLALVLLTSSGCTYLKYRGEDLLEIVDVGVTLSVKPGFALYGWGVSIAPGGVGYVDGVFVGWGGGQIGITRHYLRAVGVGIIGYEEIGWGKFDLEDRRTLHRTVQGIAGLPLALLWRGSAAYTPACVHHIHLGWVGLVANARYMEMVDFLLGWTTLDIAGDDGRKIGKWPWMSEDTLPPGDRRQVAAATPPAAPPPEAKPRPKAKPRPEAQPRAKPKPPQTLVPPARPPRPRAVTAATPLTFTLPSGQVTCFGVYSSARTPLTGVDAEAALRDGIREALTKAECELLTGKEPAAKRNPAGTARAFSAITGSLEPRGFASVAEGEVTCRLIREVATSKGTLRLVHASVTVDVDGDVLGLVGRKLTFSVVGKDASLGSAADAARRARVKAAEMIWDKAQAELGLKATDK